MLEHVQIPSSTNETRREQREELFTERYPRLLSWALSLTNQHRASAEDLVQDAFIQFTLSRTRLEQIENIDGYLRRMLRYMHLSRVCRKAERMLDQTFSISDQSSFSQSCQLLDMSNRMQIEEELYQICTYACARKESSKAGSVLILRFFHDYLPTEIAQILCSSRHCVDQWQRLARMELKVYLTNSNRLRFVCSKKIRKPIQTKLPYGSGNFLVQLRQLILEARQGDCLSNRDLENIYNEPDAAPSTTQLAHIVSCLDCLETINSLLGLDQKGGGENPEGNGSASDGSSGNRNEDAVHSGADGAPTFTYESSNLLERYRRRQREILEVEPTALRVLVNGKEKLQIDSRDLECSIDLESSRPLRFIEILNEQNLQLLFVCVDGSQRSLSEEWAEIELSKGQRLRVSLSTTHPIKLELSYHPKTLAASRCATLQAVPTAPAITELNRTVLERISNRLSNPYKWILGQYETSHEPDQSNVEPELFKEVLKSGQRRWWAAVWVSLLASLLLITSILFFRSGLSRPNAIHLLEQATTLEKQRNIRSRFTRQTLSLEARRFDSHEIVMRRNIEIWRDTNSGIAERVFNENGQLVAGALTRSDGTEIVYHHALKSQVRSRQLTLAQLDLQNVWQAELSADWFTRIVSNANALRVEETPDNYLFSYRLDEVSIVNLRIRRYDLHATDLYILTRFNGDLMEFRLFETELQQVREETVPPKTFEVETDFPDSNESISEKGKTGVRPRLLSKRINGPASTELEIEVAYILNRLTSSQQDQLLLSRTSDGALKVDGVVDSNERRQEILGALGPLIKNSRIEINIQTLAEASLAKGRATKTVTIDSTPTNDRVAADADIRQRLSKTSKNIGSEDEAVRIFSTTMVNHAYVMLRHTIALRQLTARFAKTDMQAVAPDARARWAEMLHQHSFALEHEISLSRDQLQPVFSGQNFFKTSDGFRINNDLELKQTITRLDALTVFCSEAIRAAFSTTAQGSDSAIKSPRFWRTLSDMQQLTRAIRAYN